VKFVSYNKLAGVPNVVVDGAAQADTVLTLSHWPKSGSPVEFRADTSTEMVLNFLATPGADTKYAPRVRAVSNNHFDEDGLCAVWAMLNPKRALQMRDALVDVASAGDFHTYRRPQAAKVVFTIRSYADAKTSPLEAKLQPDDLTGTARYQALLPLLESFLEDTERFSPFWDGEWSAMRKSITAMHSGEAELSEMAAADLAVVEAPEPLHWMVLHNQTQCLRVLTALPGGFYELRYRYETWVQFYSRTVKPRVDLTPLLPRLQALEQAPVQWTFDGIAEMTPALRPVGPGGQPAPSSLKLDRLVAELVAFFQREQDKKELQWNPN
jgi:hypothetical protein